jgi:hypothetical protein
MLSSVSRVSSVRSVSAVRSVSSVSRQSVRSVSSVSRQSSSVLEIKFSPQIDFFYSTNKLLASLNLLVIMN